MKGKLIKPEKLQKRYLELAKEGGFSVEVIFEGRPVPIVVLKKEAAVENALNIYISAGIHGDEPAGPLAIEKLLREFFFENNINWYLIPIINSSGLSLGTRENAEGIDLNRDYKKGKTKEVSAHLAWLERNSGVKFDLTISLHEDWESPGFYSYAIVPKRYIGLLDRVFEAVKRYSPINLSNEIEGMEAKKGFILHDVEKFDEILNNWDDWPEAFVLIQNGRESMHFTFETASRQPIEQRVDAQCVGIQALIEGMKNFSKKK